MLRKDRVYIIAEAGVNHNGNMDLACALIDVAKAAGADVVKFQTWKTELLVTDTCVTAEYQRNNTREETQFEMLKKLELSYENFEFLKRYCDKVGIGFLSTPDESESAAFLDTIQSMFKIGSGELTNTPFLEEIARFGKPVILSTGTGNAREINDAIAALLKGGLRNDTIHILHAVSAYPCPDHDANLLAIPTLKQLFPLHTIGYSDHTTGNTAAIAAVALGARIIEKHFTTDRNLPGPDHDASLTPAELKTFVDQIRQAECMLGDGVKRAMPSELDTREKVRKKIVARRNITTGETLDKSNIICKRAGKGLDAFHWDTMIGSVARKNYQADDPIE